MPDWNKIFEDLLERLRNRERPRGCMIIIIILLAAVLVFLLWWYDRGEHWDEVDDFAVQFQIIDIGQVGQSKFDLVVLDYADDNQVPFDFQDLVSLQGGASQTKLVVAYLSIGEAEPYRLYWKTNWVPGSSPSWLGSDSESYRVEYWDPAWQSIVKAYLDDIIAAGFDGVWLDIVDAYEYRDTKATAEAEMVQFVKDLADHARNKKKNFGVFANGGENLFAHADFKNAITGIGKEDVWYKSDGSPQDANVTTWVTTQLDKFKKAGKLVLVIDYVSVHGQLKIDDFYNKAEQRGYLPYATVIALDQLTLNSGHLPN